MTSEDDECATDADSADWNSYVDDVIADNDGSDADGDGEADTDQCECGKSDDGGRYGQDDDASVDAVANTVADALIDGVVGRRHCRCCSFRCCCGQSGR